MHDKIPINQLITWVDIFVDTPYSISSIKPVFDKVSTYFRISDENKALVTERNGRLVSVLVNQVGATIDVEEAAIQPPLATMQSEITQYIKGQIHQEETIYNLLDFPKILHSKRIEEMAERSYQSLPF